ncbi:MAG: S26 family signal peptidase, partial [Clostridia bacterium]|nr:S26 family signal peptidase [Clostridia bacterium]
MNSENFDNNINDTEINDETPITEKPEKINWMKELRDWVVAILLAVLIAFVVREYVFTLVKVQGQSMEPSLHHDDRLYVNRFFYTPEKG